jgi:hypothetical protein
MSVAVVGANSNHTCATCPTVITDEVQLLLLKHHNNNGTATSGRLPGLEAVETDIL